MADFKFGEVDAILAALNNVAPHKRVAFTGRLKFLLKNGLPSRARPGKGKAATYTFGDLMQLVIAVELMQAGLDQRRAARIVAHGWSVLRYTVYSSTFTESEVAEFAKDSPFSEPVEHSNYVWLIFPEMLAELTPTGVSEYDDYEAIHPMPANSAGTFLDTMTEVPNKRRVIVLNGSAIVRQAVFITAFQFKFATVANLREDLIDEDEALNDPELWETIKQVQKAFSPERKAAIRREMREALEADYSTSPPTPVSALISRAREMMPRISGAAKSFLAQNRQSYLETGAIRFMLDDEQTRSALVELVEFGVFELTTDELAASPASGDARHPILNLEVSPFGQAAMKVAATEGGANVDPEA